jgi:hypothetical protein
MLRDEDTKIPLSLISTYLTILFADISNIIVTIPSQVKVNLATKKQAMVRDGDFIFLFLNYVGYLGGVIWMPILGYLIGQGIESLIYGGKKQSAGGILGGLAGLGFWLIFILPRLKHIL